MNGPVDTATPTTLVLAALTIASTSSVVMA
jgi:hypothetical protein